MTVRFPALTRVWLLVAVLIVLSVAAAGWSLYGGQPVLAVLLVGAVLLLVWQVKAFRASLEPRSGQAHASQAAVALKRTEKALKNLRDACA